MDRLHRIGGRVFGALFARSQSLLLVASLDVADLRVPTCSYEMGQPTPSARWYAFGCSQKRSHFPDVGESGVASGS